MDRGRHLQRTLIHTPSGTGAKVAPVFFAPPPKGLPLSATNNPHLIPKRQLTEEMEKAVLVGVIHKDQTERQVEEYLDELAFLAETAGASAVKRFMQKLAHPDSKTYIGKGKLEEVARYIQGKDIRVLIFDDELTGAQARNLEKIFVDCKVLDRTALILEIFAQRARTREGKLQVELAQLEYLFPRLTRYWTHLSRQRGSTGSIGGEGESQLEADRRKTQERIDKIKSELQTVRRQRATQRAGRQRHQWPLASIVGYTNAGKSTLLNALTASQVRAEDKLFATLDASVRSLDPFSHPPIVAIDTVGFIRDLPRDLFAAFRATFEEAAQVARWIETLRAVR